MSTIAITVTGKVQGVWYRASTRKKAVELGLTGTVQNQSDGSVYIEATGPKDQLLALEKWCHSGPVHAKVDQVQVTEIPDKEFTNFSIVR